MSIQTYNLVLIKINHTNVRTIDITIQKRDNEIWSCAQATNAGEFMRRYVIIRRLCYYLNLEGSDTFRFAKLKKNRQLNLNNCSILDPYAKENLKNVLYSLSQWKKRYSQTFYSVAVEFISGDAFSFYILVSIRF